MEIPRVFRPSVYGASGIMVAGFQILEKENAHRNGNPLLLRIVHVALRILAALIIAVACVVDLCMWACMTLPLFPVYWIGLTTHLQNLVSTVSLPILALGIPFGYWPPFDDFRFFHDFRPCDRQRPDLHGLFSVRLNRINFLNALVKAAKIPRGARIPDALERASHLFDRKGNALIEVIQYPSVVKMLLNSGVKPHPKMIVLASMYGYPDTVKHLLDAGADPNSTDLTINFSHPALLAALVCGCVYNPIAAVEIATILIRNEALISPAVDGFFRKLANEDRGLLDSLYEAAESESHSIHCKRLASKKGPAEWVKYCTGYLKSKQSELYKLRDEIISKHRKIVGITLEKSIHDNFPEMLSSQERPITQEPGKIIAEMLLSSRTLSQNFLKA